MTRDSVIADRAILAADSRSRRVGLLKRESLPEGEGLIIAPCECIHTFGMKFPIDVVFISKKRKILKIAASIPKRRIALSLFADSVLELPAGTLARTRSSVGDELSFEAVPSGS